MRNGDEMIEGHRLLVQQLVRVFQKENYEQQLRQRQPLSLLLIDSLCLRFWRFYHLQVFQQMLLRFQFDEAFLEMSIVTEIYILNYLVSEKVTDKSNF